MEKMSTDRYRPSPTIISGNQFGQLGARLGRSDARVFEQLTHASADEISFTGSIPQRVSIFGLTTMPQPQLDLFQGVIDKDQGRSVRSRVVIVEVGVCSISVARRLRFPALRDAHPRPIGGFRLNEVWGRTNEEGHTLLLDSVLATSGEVEGPPNLKVTLKVKTTALSCHHFKTPSTMTPSLMLKYR